MIPPKSNKVSALNHWQNRLLIILHTSTQCFKTFSLGSRVFLVVWFSPSLWSLLTKSKPFILTVCTIQFSLLLLLLLLEYPVFLVCAYSQIYNKFHFNYPVHFVFSSTSRFEINSASLLYTAPSIPVNVISTPLFVFLQTEITVQKFKRKQKQILQLSFDPRETCYVVNLPEACLYLPATRKRFLLPR